MKTNLWVIGGADVFLGTRLVVGSWFWMLAFSRGPLCWTDFATDESGLFSRCHKSLSFRGFCLYDETTPFSKIN